MAETKFCPAFKSCEDDALAATLGSDFKPMTAWTRGGLEKVSAGTYKGVGSGGTKALVAIAKVCAALDKKVWHKMRKDQLVDYIVEKRAPEGLFFHTGKEREKAYAAGYCAALTQKEMAGALSTARREEKEKKMGPTHPLSVAAVTKFDEGGAPAANGRSAPCVSEAAGRSQLKRKQGHALSRAKAGDASRHETFVEMNKRRKKENDQFRREGFRCATCLSFKKGEMCVPASTNRSVLKLFIPRTCSPIFEHWKKNLAGGRYVITQHPLPCATAASCTERRRRSTCRLPGLQHERARDPPRRAGRPGARPPARGGRRVHAQEPGHCPRLRAGHGQVLRPP